ncbi:hypothetical protein ACWC5I_05395 [Kitasatospora sp. NPDC001574]
MTDPPRPFPSASHPGADRSEERITTRPKKSGPHGQYEEAGSERPAVDGNPVRTARNMLPCQQILYDTTGTRPTLGDCLSDACGQGRHTPLRASTAACRQDVTRRGARRTLRSAAPAAVSSASKQTS